MLEIQLVPITSKKYKITIGDWSSVGVLKAVNRRGIAHIKELNDREKYKVEKLRYEYAPKKICPRCQGKGYIDHYLYVAHGICFKCGGSGKVEKK